MILVEMNSQTSLKITFYLPKPNVFALLFVNNKKLELASNKRMSVGGASKTLNVQMRNSKATSVTMKRGKSITMLSLGVPALKCVCKSMLPQGEYVLLVHCCAVVEIEVFAFTFPCD